MTNRDLEEMYKQMLPSVTAFSPRDSLSEHSSPLGLPKEFSKMEQKLQEGLASALLDDMDFVYNKVKCRRIEGILPKPNKLVEEEMMTFSQRGNR